MVVDHGGRDPCRHSHIGHRHALIATRSEELARTSQNQLPSLLWLETPSWGRLG